MDIKTITDNVKAIKEIADATQNLKLQTLILELREQVLGLREENYSLKEKLSKKTDYKMQFENNVYWNLKEDGTKIGPYCTGCWDNNEKAIRLEIGDNAYICPICKKIIYTAKSNQNNSPRITF